MFGQSGTNAEDILEHLPDELPILPLKNVVAFPFSMLPILVGSAHSLKLAQDAANGNRLIMLVTSRDPEIDNPSSEQVTSVGVVAMIQRALPGRNGTMQLFVQTLERARVTEWTDHSPYLKGRVNLTPDTEEND